MTSLLSNGAVGRLSLSLQLLKRRRPNFKDRLMAFLLSTKTCWRTVVVGNDQDTTIKER